MFNVFEKGLHNINKQVILNLFNSKQKHHESNTAGD